jgi:hypothetical protein
MHRKHNQVLIFQFTNFGKFVRTHYFKNIFPVSFKPKRSVIPSVTFWPVVNVFHVDGINRRLLTAANYGPIVNPRVTCVYEEPL